MYIDLHCMVKNVWTGGPLVPIKGAACNDTAGNGVLLTLWQQFVEGPFLFLYDSASVHKVRSIKV